MLVASTASVSGPDEGDGAGGGLLVHATARTAPSVAAPSRLIVRGIASPRLVGGDPCTPPGGAGRSRGRVAPRRFLTSLNADDGRQLAHCRSRLHQRCLFVGGQRDLDDLLDSGLTEFDGYAEELVA